MAKRKAAAKKPVIGWREWVELPDLKISRIKVKVDSGARTSALHVTDLKIYKSKSGRHVRFNVHPVQHSGEPVFRARAKLVEKRHVKSSHGHVTLRPVIQTQLKIGEFLWSIELTLVNRDMMGFRMLLGREAIRGRFVVDPGDSFLISRNRGNKNRDKNRDKTRHKTRDKRVPK